MGLILKLAILLFCIKHLLDHGRPRTAAFIYAGSLFLLGLISGLLFGWADYGLLVVFLYLPVDAATGFVFFWLLDRYRDRYLWFYCVIVIGIALNLALHFWISGITPPAVEDEERADLGRPLAESRGAPPHLWSHHKSLNVSAEVCAQNGIATLNSLGFSSVVNNNTYVYGNFGPNRAAIKCVQQSGRSSFLYLAVAGPVKQSVEDLRNKIARNM